VTYDDILYASCELRTEFLLFIGICYAAYKLLDCLRTVSDYMW